MDKIENTPTPEYLRCPECGAQSVPPWDNSCGVFCSPRCESRNLRKRILQGDVIYRVEPRGNPWEEE